MLKTWGKDKLSVLFISIIVNISFMPSTSCLNIYMVDPHGKSW